MGFCACGYGGRACWNGAADQASQLCDECGRGVHRHADSGDKR